MSMSFERVIDVFARDRNGRSIPGAKIEFTVDGRPAGEVTNSEGRARIQLPDRNSVIGVSAKYNGITETEVLSKAQDSLTFSFDTDVAPESFMERHIALVVGLVLIAVAVSLPF